MIDGSMITDCFDISTISLSFLERFRCVGVVDSIGRETKSVNPRLLEGEFSCKLSTFGVLGDSGDDIIGECGDCSISTE